MTNLIQALLAVMQEVGYVQKDGKNTFHNYKYASEAGILAAVRGAMVKNGLVLIGPTIDGEERRDEHGNVFVTVTWQLAHSSGEVWPTPLSVVGAGNDKSNKTGTVGDKGVYKAYTGAEKYLLMKLLMLATGDDPETEANADYVPDNGTPKSAPSAGDLATADQCKKMATLMGKIGMSAEDGREYLTRKYQKVSRTQLTGDEAAEFIRYLDAQAKKKAGGEDDQEPPY